MADYRVEINFAYDLPFDLEERQELYGTVDAGECVRIDLENDPAMFFSDAEILTMEVTPIEPADVRCFAVIFGSVLRGPLYCGNRAKGTDANGRPTCGVHGNKQVGVEWFGSQGRFPHGFGGDWSFGRGEPK